MWWLTWSYFVYWQQTMLFSKFNITHTSVQRDMNQNGITQQVYSIYIPQSARSKIIPPLPTYTFTRHKPRCGSAELFVKLHWFASRTPESLQLAAARHALSVHYYLFIHVILVGCRFKLTVFSQTGTWRERRWWNSTKAVAGYKISDLADKELYTSWNERKVTALSALIFTLKNGNVKTINHEVVSFLLTKTSSRYKLIVWTWLFITSAW